MGIFDGIGQSLARSLGTKLTRSMLTPILNLLKGDGLKDLIAKFNTKGLGDLVSSWVSTGQNKPVTKGQMRHALGDEQVADLARQMGLSEDEALAQLQEHLPTAIDTVTPAGTLPEATDLEKMLKIQ